MTYTKQTWRDGDRSTPLSATRLSHVETGIAEAHNLVGEKLSADELEGALPDRLSEAALTDKIEALSSGSGSNLIEDPDNPGLYLIGA